MSDTIAQSLADLHVEVVAAPDASSSRRELVAQLEGVAERLAELAARARDAEQNHASVADELVRVLSEPVDQRAVARVMRLALFHLTPGRLEELDKAAAADEPERVESADERCTCNPAFGTDSRCPKHGAMADQEPVVGPLEQWTLDTTISDGGPPTTDDINNAVSQLAGLLDEMTEELGALVREAEARGEPGAQRLRRIVRILKLEVDP